MMRRSRQTVLLARRAPTINGRNGTRVDLLLPERARSECARSTAAVRPDTGTVPDKGKRASLEGTVLSLDARSEEQSAYSFWESRRIRRPSLGSKRVSARWGWAGEKVARSRRPIRPILEEPTSELGRGIDSGACGAHGLRSSDARA
jgi:hypothetical protein